MQKSGHLDIYMEYVVDKETEAIIWSHKPIYYKINPQELLANKTNTNLNKDFKRN